MECPQCGREYPEGVTVCTVCGVELAPLQSEEEEAEWLELETVLETSDPALLPVVRSALEAGGNPCYAQGETLQDFIGVGRVAGLNLVTGPVELQVPVERAEEAREILAAAEVDLGGEVVDEEE